MVSDKLPLVKTSITYLRMTSPPKHTVIPAPDIGGISIDPCEPTVDYYLKLYDAVGSKWTWVNRKHMCKDELSNIINNELVEIYVIYVRGKAVGYAELDRRRKKEIDLAYFGLIPDCISLGLGKYFLDWIIRKAWSYDPESLIVNTCTEDHPRALPLYKKFGFEPYGHKFASLDPNVKNQN